MGISIITFESKQAMIEANRLGGSHKASSGQTHHHSEKYYMFGDLFVDGDLWNLSQPQVFEQILYKEGKIS